MQKISDSERSPVPGSHLMGSPDLNSEIEILISLANPSNNMSDSKQSKPKNAAVRDQEQTRTQFYAAALQIVLNFANEFHLRQVGDPYGGYLIRFAGTVENVNRAFNVKLQTYAYPLGSYLSHDDGAYVPENVWPYIDTVLGLDTRQIAKPYLDSADASLELAGPNAAWLKQVTTAYALRADLSGEKECIGILEFGGQLSQADIYRYFKDLQSNQPDVYFVPIPASGSPFPGVKADWEIALDTEVAGSIAPKATIVVYIAPNSEAGWALALGTAVNDKKYNPKVISISWGNSEAQWSPDLLKTLMRILKDTTQTDITVCAASGDDGCDIDLNGKVQVSFPASSPYVLACGGTTIQSDNTEVVWNDDGRRSASGGGISDVIQVEPWQKGMPVPPPLPRRRTANDGRRLPDVAALAAARYNVFSKGNYVNNLGGTSAAAPIWAGILALLNQALLNRGLSRVGFLNERLYTMSSLNSALGDVQSGNNGVGGINGYVAAKQWDACTGWGSPNVQKLLTELSKALIPSRKSSRKKAFSLQKKKS